MQLRRVWYALNIGFSMLVTGLNHSISNTRYVNLKNDAQGLSILEASADTIDIEHALRRFEWTFVTF